VSGCSFQASVSAAGTPASTGAAGGTLSAAATSSGAPAAGSGATAPRRCHTGELTASLVPGSPGAGQRYATLVLQNTGGQTCTVEGYGGIGLVDASGSALPTQQLRVPSPAPVLVPLPPRASVRSQLHWSAVPGAGDATAGDCAPTAAALQVIPPDETTPLSVAWTQGPVCERGTITQQAYAAG
jgi:hypothetical protein